MRFFIYIFYHVKNSKKKKQQKIRSNDDKEMEIS